MKNILYTLTLALLLGACSTSTNDDPSHFGTWRVDTKTHATWQGTQNRPVASVAMAVASDTDTTAKPDTTYFYSNDKIQATLIPVPEYIPYGEVQLNVHQDINGLVFGQSYSGAVIVNLDNSFDVVGQRGSGYSPDFFEIHLQINFDCDIQNQPKNLIIAILKYQQDSVKTPPDTLMYYNLSTKGMYSTAKYLKGCN